MTSALAARKAALAALALQPAIPAPKAPSPPASLPSLPSSEDDVPGPSKRRKVTTSKKTARYFAPASESGSENEIEDIRQMKKRNRKFSPSAPASEADDGMDDSSEEEVSSVGEEVDEGRAVWTAPTPARAAPVKVTSSGSKFKPVTGVNVSLVTDEELAQSGIQGEGSGVVISLGKQESVMLAGIYTILPLKNVVNILSTTLYPSSSPIPVFGPSSHPTPVITPSVSRRRTPASEYMRRLPLPPTFNVGENRTIFLIKEYECGFQGLRNGVVPGFSNIWGDSRGLLNLRGVHLNNSTIHHPHVQPESWTDPLRSLSPEQSPEDDDEDEDEYQTPPIVLVKGPKRSGKSTFARATLNNLLNRYEQVAWLECDLGQGEFSPGGVVGLWIVDSPALGPPFTHPRVAERAHYLGSFTPQTCPDEYIAAIQHLINHYTYEIAHPLLSPQSTKITSVIPLVINTQGWVKGLGEELLRSIESCTSPSHVCTFELPEEPSHVNGNGNGNGNGWTSSPPPEIPHNYTHLARPPIIYTLQSAPVTPLLARHTPSDLRTLSMIAYFHAHLDARKWDFSIPLLATAPFQVELSTSQASPLRRVYITGEGSESILPDDLGLALNGNIVALIHEVDQDPNIDSLFDPSRPIPLDETTYLGLALIRGIKPSEGGFTLHLLTPLGEESLGKANAIIRNGAVELPLPGMLDWRAPNANDLAGVKWEDVPYLDISGVVGVGGERRRFRRNLMRKGM